MPSNGGLTLGAVCVDKSQAGRTVWEMRADERFANPAGVVQGGYLAALADEAMGSATVTYRGHERVLSSNAEMKVSFMRPAIVGSMLRCTGLVVSAGRRAVFCEAEIVDDSGRVVARSSSTYLVSGRDDERVE